MDGSKFLRNANSSSSTPVLHQASVGERRTKTLIARSGHARMLQHAINRWRAAGLSTEDGDQIPARFELLACVLTHLINAGEYATTIAPSNIIGQDVSSWRRHRKCQQKCRRRSHTLVREPVTQNEDRDLSRGLHQRHISLIAIAGAIGTGLFLGLGSAITTAGPAGALLGYATIGLIVCAVQFALGEVTALLPVTGSFVRHAEFLVDPAMGFAVGWNIVRIAYIDSFLQPRSLVRCTATGSPSQQRSPRYAFCSNSGRTSILLFGLFWSSY